MIQSNERAVKPKKAPASKQKFKTRSQILIEEYRKPSVPKEKLYVIDKVVRMRALQGRYGVDHSEVLNYEFEIANKDRADHMNTLVYRGNASVMSSAQETIGRHSMHRTQSNAIFERLTEKEIEATT